MTETTDNEALVEELARVIANAMGDNYSDAFIDKTRWIAKRGMSGGRFRDVNEPFRCDYADAARAAIAHLTRRDAETWNRAIEAAGQAAYDRLHPHPNNPESNWTDFAKARAVSAMLVRSAIARLKDKQ